MNPELNHVFLTRFNLPSLGVESMIRAKDGWLRGRVELFERYCLPSVRAQTSQDFEWIIYFDPESPAWLMEWIESHRAQGDFSAIFRASVSPRELVDDLRSVLPDRRGGLLTTNLDNDDAVAVDFVERVQAIGLPAQRTAVYLSRGLIQSGRRVYRRTDRTNAFCSVVETWENPQTCWSDWHNRLGRSMPVHEIAGRPAWLQVVHGANVSNRVHGLLTAPVHYVSLFPGLLDELPEPSSAELLTDRMLRVPVRVLRDSSRAMAKRVVLALAGKGGLDRAKSVLALRGRPGGGL